MHAKVWLCDNKLIVGTANISANGLGFDNADSLRANIEAAVYSDTVPCAQHVHAWFDDLWKISDEINSDEIRWAEEQWKARSKIIGPRRIKRDSLMQAVKSKKNQKLLKDVHILVWRDSNKKTSEEATNFFTQEAQLYYSPKDWINEHNRDYYSCWHTKWQFKKDQIFLDYIAPAGGKKTLTFRGIHRIVTQDNQYHKVGANDYIILF